MKMVPDSRRSPEAGRPFDDFCRRIVLSRRGVLGTLLAVVTASMVDAEPALAADATCNELGVLRCEALCVAPKSGCDFLCNFVPGGFLAKQACKLACRTAADGPLECFKRCRRDDALCTCPAGTQTCLPNPYLNIQKACCGPDEICTPLGCAPKECGDCEQRTALGQCVTTCQGCDTCVDGACVSTCRPCERCDTVTGGGQCRSNCIGPETCCDSCVDLRTNDDNCGECGRRCPAGQSCDNGVCGCNGQTCAPGLTCCDGACVDTVRDPYHCGCTTECAPGSKCCDGKCSDGCPDGVGRTPCCVVATSGELLAGSICPGTQICYAGNCVWTTPGCVCPSQTTLPGGIWWSGRQCGPAA